MCSSHSYLSNSILISSRRCNAPSSVSFSSSLLFSHRLPRFLYSGQYPCEFYCKRLNFHYKYLLSSKKRTFSADGREDSLYLCIIIISIINQQISENNQIARRFLIASIYMSTASSIPDSRINSSAPWMR